MRIFLAGASGALGRRLVPLLVRAGHDVVGTTRTRQKMAEIEEAGAQPVLMDGLDASAVECAVIDAEPDVVVHQLTSLAHASDLRRFDRSFAATNELRTTTTDRLLSISRRVGVERFVAQGFAGWPLERSGGPVKTEDDPLDPEPPKAARQTLAAIRHVETAVPRAGDLVGIVLRYGSFYGPGTSLGPDGELTELVRRRRLPLVGGGGGVWSFCHIDDAAVATVAAVEQGDPGVYHVVDDDPAPVSEWLPYLATCLGARPPARVPAWLARPAIGAQGVSMMTRIRGASNEKARAELGWKPEWPSWRQGFRDGLG